MKIGLVGLGNLGFAMAANLREAGHEVIGYRRSAMDAFAAAGGVPAASPRELAGGADVVLTCLSSEDALNDVYLGADGLLAVARAGLVAFELSTLPLRAKLALRQAAEVAGATLLDGAVSGNPHYMAARNAAIFIGGDRAAFETYAPMLRDITARVTWVGEFGAGRLAKFVAFYLVCVHTLAAAEALELATRAGLDRAAMFEAIKGSNATSAMFESRGALMAARDYAGYDAGKRPENRGRENVPGRGMANRSKNVANLAALAHDLGGSYPLLDAMDALYAEAAASGFGAHDIAEVFEYLIRDDPRPPDPDDLLALLEGRG